MKILDPAFQEAISLPITTITWCWLIERLDGVKLGFTSFDLPLTIDGIVYEPTIGFAPSADSSEVGFKQSDSQSLNGILSSERISDNDLGDRATYRPITKPVEGTVKIYLNSLAVRNYRIDYSTGILTFDPAPNDQDIIAAEFEFDIPVWFEKDEFPYTLQGYQKNPQTQQSQALYKLGNLAVQEGRIPLILPYTYLNPSDLKILFA